MSSFDTNSDGSLGPSKAPGAGLLMKDFITLSSHLSREEFMARFVHPFLIQLSKEDEQDANVGFGTISGSMRRLLVESDTSNCRVYFVAKQDTNAFSMMITVGRAENNDIVVRYGKVSKFHAYFNQTGEEWFLTDSNSSNGTYLQLKALQPGTKTPIMDRSEVSFSRDLSFQFLTPVSMYTHLQLLSAR